MPTPILLNIRWALNADTYERALTGEMLAAVSDVVGMERLSLPDYPTEFRTTDEGSLTYDGVRNTRIEKRSLSTIGAFEMRTEVELFGDQGQALARLSDRSAKVTAYPWNSDSEEISYFDRDIVTLRWLVAAKNPVELARYAAVLMADDPSVVACPGSGPNIVRLDSSKHALTIQVDATSGELLRLASDRIVGPGLALSFVFAESASVFPARVPARIYTVDAVTQMPVAVVLVDSVASPPSIDASVLRWQSTADRALVTPGDRWELADDGRNAEGRLPSPRLAPGSGPSSPPNQPPAVVAGPPLLPQADGTGAGRYWLAASGFVLMLVALAARLIRRGSTIA